MKGLFLILLFAPSAFAGPLAQMDRRLSTYQESSTLICEAGEPLHADHGLFVDVSCQFQCRDSTPKIERVKGSFVPKQLGLRPGNGSSPSNVVWSSVGVTLRSWAQGICMRKAAAGCKNLGQVASSEVSELASGNWKLTRFPSCQDKSLTLSPFDESAGTSRISNASSVLINKVESSPQFTGYAFKAAGLKFLIPFGTELTTCQHKIKAQLCFGDCIDMAAKAGDFKETLGTIEPLGKEEVELCGDDLAGKLKGKDLSASVKQQICEDYFWKSLTSSKNIVTSCAAIRGDVICPLF